jgi:hypothetical protein
MMSYHHTFTSFIGKSLSLGNKHGNMILLCSKQHSNSNMVQYIGGNQHVVKENISSNLEAILGIGSNS